MKLSGHVSTVHSQPEQSVCPEYNTPLSLNQCTDASYESDYYMLSSRGSYRFRPGSVLRTMNSGLLLKLFNIPGTDVVSIFQVIKKYPTVIQQ